MGYFWYFSLVRWDNHIELLLGEVVILLQNIPHLQSKMEAKEYGLEQIGHGSHMPTVA